MFLSRYSVSSLTSCRVQCLVRDVCVLLTSVFSHLSC